MKPWRFKEAVDDIVKDIADEYVLKETPKVELGTEDELKELESSAYYLANDNQILISKAYSELNEEELEESDLRRLLRHELGHYKEGHRGSFHPLIGPDKEVYWDFDPTEVARHDYEALVHEEGRGGFSPETYANLIITLVERDGLNFKEAQRIMGNVAREKGLDYKIAQEGAKLARQYYGGVTV